MRKEISPEKLRDMTRSILPSTERERARRNKAAVKRRTRRAVHQDIHRFDDDSPVDLLRDARMRVVVNVRRSYDKVNHFMRWCETLTRGMTLQRKLDYVRALLPKSLIGDHAFSHWEAYCIRKSRGYTFHKDEYQRYAQSLFDRTRHALRVALANDPTLLGELNADIKRRKLEDEMRRLLHGVHDIDDFVREVMISDNRGCYKAERSALRSLKLIE
ncbi:MAG TPA: hypothetical protein VF787_15345 [Thermoanaerobaculia bacterium]